MASHLPGRTDNDIKNYWNTKLKKRLPGGLRSGRSRPAGRANDDEACGPSSESTRERIQLNGYLSPFSFYSHGFSYIMSGDTIVRPHANTTDLIATMPMIESTMELRSIPSFGPDANVPFDSSFNFATNPLSGEISTALYDQSRVFGGHEIDRRPVSDSDCFVEMNGVDHQENMNIMNWWDGNGFDERLSSPSSWGYTSVDLHSNSTIQECIVGSIEGLTRLTTNAGR